MRIAGQPDRRWPTTRITASVFGLRESVKLRRWMVSRHAGKARRLFRVATYVLPHGRPHTQRPFTRGDSSHAWISLRDWLVRGWYSVLHPIVQNGKIVPDRVEVTAAMGQPRHHIEPYELVRLTLSHCGSNRLVVSGIREWGDARVLGSV